VNKREIESWGLRGGRKPKAPFGDPFIGMPDAVSGQVNVLPTNRREMLQKRLLN
jgi:hypothetical protein